MTIYATGDSRWQQLIDQAKAEIFGPESQSAPAPLVNLATRQLLPIIHEMERQIHGRKMDSTMFIHLNQVQNRYVDGSVEVLEAALSSQFFSRSCARFVERYERMLSERNITMPSPS